MNLFHEFGAWLFFHDVHITPFGIAGLFCLFSLLDNLIERVKR